MIYERGEFVKIKEVYDRIGVSKARMPVLVYLPNKNMYSIS